MLAKNYFKLTPVLITLLGVSNVSAFEIDAGSTKANIYGFAKLNMLYDVDRKMGSFVNHRSIALDGAKVPTGHTQFDASHSRLGVKTTTTTDQGDVVSVIEGDFNTAAGAGPFRLRHAYLTWNGILAGQTWTNFGGFLGTMPTLDHLGQVGQGAILRQPQLRYTTGGLSVALEQGGAFRGAIAASADPSIIPQSKESLPDFTARYQLGVGDAKLAASAVVRQVEYYDNATNDEEAAFGWGLNLEGLVPLTDIFTVRGAFTYGDGVGGYLYQSPAAPAYVDTSGDVETIKSMGGTFGVSAKAGVGTINLGYGFSTADIDDAVSAGALAGSDNEAFESIYLNYMWSPLQHMTYGVEAGLHSRETQNGSSGDAVRVQAQVVYNF